MTRHRARPLLSVAALILPLLALLGATALPANALGDRADRHNSQGEVRGGQGHGDDAAEEDSESTDEQDDPPGNNGTVKIERVVGTDEGTPDNNPHPGCTFLIEWYGYDEGPDINSHVTFTAQSPTGGQVAMGGTSPSEVFVGEDPATGAGTPTGLDGSQEYTLTFTDEPHPQQGYHVKLTVETPYSQGADVKQKVYWVEPCDQDAAAAGEEAAGEGDESAPAEETDLQATDSEQATAGNVEVEGEQPASGGVEVLGEQASVSGSQAAQESAAQAAETGAAPVPSAIEAGLNGLSDLSDEAWSRQLAAALGVLLGVALAGVVLLRRRSRARAVATRD